MLGRLSPTPEVERLQSAARLSASRDDDVADLELKLEQDPDDEGTRLDLAVAARGEFEPALDQFLGLVRAKGERWDEARQAMLDIFGVLGDEHPLSATYRRQLTNALFERSLSDRASPGQQTRPHSLRSHGSCDAAYPQPQ